MGKLSSLLSSFSLNVFNSLSSSLWLSNPFNFSPLINMKSLSLLLFLYSYITSSVTSIGFSYFVNLKCNLILSELIFSSPNFFWKYIGSKVMNSFSLNKSDKSYIFEYPSKIQLFKKSYIFFNFFVHSLVSTSLVEYFDRLHSLGIAFLLRDLIISQYFSIITISPFKTLNKELISSSILFI